MQIKDLDAAIESIMLEMDSVIMSIPGIGYLNGAMILGEIGNISRFSEPSKLLVFAGLDLSCQAIRKISGKRGKNV